VTVEFDMAVRRVYTSSRVSANTGRAAVQRGPLIYCAEGVDNENDILSRSLKKEGRGGEKKDYKYKWGGG